MRSRSINIAIALIIAFLSAAGLFFYVKGLQDRVIAGEKIVKVYVAQEAVKSGVKVDTLVTGGKVRETEIPAKFVADGAVSSIDVYSEYVLDEDLARGEQLTASSVNKEEDAGLSIRIPAGYVAMSIEVDPVNFVGGNVANGDTISVFATFERNSGPIPISKQILASVFVLDVQSDTVVKGGSFAKSGSSAGQGKAIITMALQPGQAEKLAYAQSEGEIYVTLQRKGDVMPVKPGGVTGATVIK